MASSKLLGKPNNISANLAKFQPPRGSQILLDVDDVLLASPTNRLALKTLWLC